MLSDEERKAIERFKNFIYTYQDVIEDEYSDYEEKESAKEYQEVSEKILNLIKKQSKEIEHQKEKRENQKKELAILNAKQIEFNKLVNTVNSYKGQFKKQQKEIEELRNEVMEKELMIDGMKEDRRIAVEEIQEQYYVSKDKIKEILGIEEDIDNEKLVSLLQTIVDENARLEDIEDRKIQIEYNNVFNKGVKKVEDKIKAKIEEQWDKKQKARLEIGSLYKYAIAVLQSLLEKE